MSLSTTATGTFSETITLHADGSNSSGYNGALPDQVWTITGTVIPATVLAQPTLNTQTSLSFGNLHVGQSADRTLSASNGINATEALDVAISGVGGNVTAHGSIAQLAPGQTDTSSVTLSLDTSAAGAKTGFLDLAFASHGAASTTALPGQRISASGNVYRLAEASILTPTSVTFANRHVGTPATQTITVRNIAAGDGFSEKLSAQVSANSPGVLGAGAFALLNAGATDSSSLTVAIDAATAGRKSGTATVVLSSDGAGTSGLGVTALSSRSITVAGDVFRLASVAVGPLSNNFVAHIGDTAIRALTVTNIATADGFSEYLTAAAGIASAGVIISGSASLVAPGASDSTHLVVGIDTSTVGFKAGTATVNPVSDGTGSSQLGITSLLSQTIGVSGTVYRVASTDAVLPGVHLVAHVGDVASKALSIRNTAAPDGFSERLGATINTAASGISASGAFSLLAPGAADSSALTVGISTQAAGHTAGSATVTLVSDGSGTSGLGNTPLGSRTVNISGDVYRLAHVSIDPFPTSLIVHVGDAGQRSLTIRNTAIADGYSESLTGVVVSESGDITVTGSIGGIAPGSSGTGLHIGFSTIAPGVVSGTVSLRFVSDGAAAGLGSTNLGQQVVVVNATVNNYAKATIQKLSGAGTLTQNGNAITVDLGQLQQGTGSVSLSLAVLNAASGLSDSLSGSLVVPSGTGPFSHTGPQGFSNLGAQQASSAFGVTLSTAAIGDFSETIVLRSTGTNAGGYAGALPDQTLTINATVVAAPSSLASAPLVTVTDTNVAHLGALAAADVFNARSDATRFEFRALNGWPAARVVLDGREQPALTVIQLTKDQLSRLTFEVGYLQTDFELRASNGTTWSEWQKVRVTAPDNHATVIQVSDQTQLAGAEIALTSLFSWTDQEGDTPAAIYIWDLSPGGSSIRVNGVERAAGELIAVTSLNGLTFEAGAAGSVDQIRVQAYDGIVWGASTTFSVTAVAGPPPVLTVQNTTVGHLGALSAANIFTVSSDATLFEFRALNDWPAARVVLDGRTQPALQVISLTKAELSRVTFEAGYLQTDFELRASNGLSWTAWQKVRVVAPDNAETVITAPNIVLTQGSEVPLASLFSVWDAEGDNPTGYHITDLTAGGGSIRVNGIEQLANSEVALSSLSGGTFRAGAAGSSDQLLLNVYDGIVWRRQAVSFMVSAVADKAPVITANSEAIAAGTVKQASMLFSVSDVENHTITRYQLRDNTPGASSGFFLVGEVPKPALDSFEVESPTGLGFQGGSTGDDLEVRAFDGQVWSAWAHVTINGPVASPTATTKQIRIGQSAAVTSLVNGIAGANRYQFLDGTPTTVSGRLLRNGAEAPANQPVDLMASQLSELTFVAGNTTGTDTLFVRGSIDNGANWGAWKPVDVTIIA